MVIEGRQPQGIGHTENGKTIGNMVDAYQSIVKVEYISIVKILNCQSINGILWQRNYYEHITRNEKSHEHNSKYIGYTIRGNIKFLFF
ncbi:MAG: hypothetical protein PHC83_04660 [Bacteroidales bacterium]|nr:hypothetical protein [Bacteroidales bacterium]MDD4209119.1 hypothetical protein [Bacteroidales bacterium]